MGLKPVNTANGSARKITPTGHKNTCIHKQQQRSVLSTYTAPDAMWMSLEITITALQPLELHAELA